MTQVDGGELAGGEQLSKHIAERMWTDMEITRNLLYFEIARQIAAFLILEPLDDLFVIKWLSIVMSADIYILHFGLGRLTDLTIWIQWLSVQSLSNMQLMSSHFVHQIQRDHLTGKSEQFDG